MTAALASARFVHLAACTLLFGLSLYRLYARPPAGARPWLTVGVVLAAASGLAWLALVTRNLAETLDLEALKTVVTQTSFGGVTVARLGLILSALFLIGRPRALVVASAFILGSIALTGHTQSHEGLLRLAHEGADAIHLIGAGAWLGGLMGLTLMLRSPAAPAADVARFSRVAYFAVAGIVLSGLVNASLLVGSPAALFDSPYGRLLLFKLALFAGMLVLAGINRFVVSPRLVGADGAGQARRLRSHVLVEQILGFGVLASVAVLGLGQPPG